MTQAKYRAEWGTSYAEPGAKEVGIEFFTHEMGYDDNDRAAIGALDVGEQVMFDAGDHSVTREE